MGLQISLGKVVAAFDCNILILCEALHFILRLQCNLAYMICWRGESKIVKALEWRIWEFYLSPKNSSSSFTSCSSFLKSLVHCLSSLIVRLAGPGPGAILAGGLFAASRLSWQWSMVAEVFTLNNLFVGLLLVLTASFHCAENATQRRRVTQSETASLSVSSYQCLIIKNLLNCTTLKCFTSSDCTLGSAVLWFGAV